MYKRVEAKTHTISSDSYNLSIDSAIVGQLPTLMCIGFVSNNGLAEELSVLFLRCFLLLHSAPAPQIDRIHHQSLNRLSLVFGVKCIIVSLYKTTQRMSNQCYFVLAVTGLLLAIIKRLVFT